ncbi:uncharacterized protein si:ch211-79h18.2 [Ictalurus furcatus]|uniref:uncharacterized protein si:ch211-79h18.2 n=1 Tax=Ictalurus furcatus TaxID=66913 RepID=UPI0023506BE6|nr:uncharacterized protein si:ch211-79h18.2 [Ictalurus furcatus]
MGADILLRQGLRPRNWWLHPQVVESIWFGQAGLHVFASEEFSVVCPHSSRKIRAGCHGAHVAEATSVRFSTARSAPTSSSESSPRQSMSAASSTLLASSNMVLRDNIPARWHSLGESHPQGSTVDPVNCTVATVLEFLQESFSAG